MTGPNSLTLNDGKAGMEGLDVERINSIIRETSRGSKFYLHAEEKEKELARKVEKMLQERDELTEQMIKESEEELGAALARLDSARDTTRDIVHVDMDAFFAAVEMRDDPTLRDRPMAVGSSAMLSTSNYLARRHGVRAAMPGFIAKKLCPDLVIVPGNHAKYSEVSSQVMKIIGKYTTEFSAMSLDEVYCDLTELVGNRTLPSEQCPVHGVTSSDLQDQTTPATEVTMVTMVTSSPDKPPPGNRLVCWCRREDVVGYIVQELRRDIQQATQLTASAGISCNTFLAKVCSELNKPNGQYHLPPEREAILDFVAELEIKKVPGIGRVQQAHLSALGVHKLADIITQRGTLARLFTPGTVNFYLTAALGLGSNQVSGREEGRSSMSTESTFTPTNVNNKDNKLTQEILVTLSELSESLANRLKAENLSGETVSVKLKLSSFEVLQRSRTLSYAVSSKESIEYIAVELLTQLVRDMLSGRSRGTCLSARLLGVKVHKFVSTTTQSSILSYTLGGGQHPVSSKTWDCPVCGASLPARIVPFNKHVDTCVTNPVLVAGETERKVKVKVKANQTPEKVTVSHAEVDGRDSSSYLATSSSLSDTSCQRGRKRKLSGEVIGETECLTKSHHSGRWECPVCSKMLYPDLATFNIHIDRCLNQGNASSTSRSNLATSSTSRNGGTKTSGVIEEATKLESGGPQSLLKYFKPDKRK